MGFASATAVTRVDEHTWLATVEPGWDINGNANGGYLLAIAGRAMAEAAGRPDPVTVSAHYLSPGKVGPLVVRCDTVKAGKRFVTLRASVATEQGTPVLAVLGAFSDLSRPADAPEYIDADLPELPAPQDCVRQVQGEDVHIAFRDQIEMRLHPDDAAWIAGRPSGRSEIRGWFRLRDGEPMDALTLLQAVDAFPPTIFNLDLPAAWTPTVELTAHVRARPVGDWLRCRFRTRYITGGFLEEDGDVWDATGRFVAQSRQLALMPRPPEAAG
ncbi:MAG: thioesterase family protein [Acidimicrobiales bacterium]